MDTFSSWLLARGVWLVPVLPPGGDTRDGTPDLAGPGWKVGEDREARDAALSAELARYMIRTEPLGMDRHHQRYWHMQVGRE